MSDRESPSTGRRSGHDRSSESPEAAEGHPASGWTVLNASRRSPALFRPPTIGTSHRMMRGIDLNGPDYVPVESSMRSTLHREPPPTFPANVPVETPPAPRLESLHTTEPRSLPSLSALDMLTAAATAVEADDGPRTPDAPRRSGHKAVSHTNPDPDSLSHPWLQSALQIPIPSSTSQPVRSLADAVADLDIENDDRGSVFPHNFDYEQNTTLERLKAYFDPSNPQITIHPVDLEDIEGENDTEKITTLLQALNDAAVIGYNAASRIDNKSGKGSEIKMQNRKWNIEWDKALDEQELPLMKGAVAVGYRVAKRYELARNGQLDKFFVCERGAATVSGCTQNQYRRDAHRSGISDYFGRNKKATKFMSGLPNWCRKDYQNQSYLDESWQRQKRHIITATIDNIEKQARKDDKSNVTFAIKLRSRDQQRVVEEATGKGIGAPPKNNKRPADLDVLKHIHREYCGEDKSADDCKKLVQWAYDDYEEKLAKFREGKTEKEIKKHIKETGPKYVEFQLLPEWEKLYTEEELSNNPGGNAEEEAEEDDDDDDSVLCPATPSTGKLVTPRTKTPKRGRKDQDGDEGQEDSPFKKLKK